MDIKQFLKQLAAEANKGYRKPVEQRINKLLQDNAMLGAAWRDVATAAKMVGELQLATQCMQRFANVDKTINGKLQYAGLLAESGKLTQALDELDKLKDTGFSVMHLKGVCFSQLGRFEEAKDCFYKAIEQHPHSGPTWLSLIAIDKSEATANNIAKVEIGMEQQSDFDKCQYYFALAMVTERQGDLEATLQYLEKANSFAKILFQNDGFSIETDKNIVDMIAANYTQDYVENFPTAKKDVDVTPIFILGTPRSGTTLLEQVISQSPEVTGVGEAALNRQSLIPARIEIVENQNTKGLPIEQKEALIQHFQDEYLHLLAQKSELNTSHFVEKSLDNIRYLPILKKAFPNAKFVYLTRDTIDNAWSCYRNFFNQGLSWSYDTSTIVPFLKAEHELAANWLNQYSDKAIYTVSYENFVADPIKGAEELFNYLGLEFKADFVDAKVGSQVQTVSVLQAREEITTDSIGKGDRVKALFS
jgi:hypothetical protein